MISGSPRSIPSASAGKQSVIKLIHRRCTGSKMVKPSRVATKMVSTSAKLEDSKN